MLCFEISINGQEVCVAGNPTERRLSVDVYRNRNESVSNICVAGDSYSDNGWSERIVWGNQRLEIGDLVLIKVIDGDRPDTPIETHAIKASEETQKLTYSIVRTVAELWLKHLLDGKPLPFPASGASASPDSAKPELLFCEFCGKSQNEVQKLIASPGKVHICDECVGVCVDILQNPENVAEAESTTAALARWPTR